MTALKVRKIGNSVGVIFPREIVERMHVAEGDRLFATETPDGFRLTPYDPEFETAMEAFERVWAKRRDAFRELAKR